MMHINDPIEEELMEKMLNTPEPILKSAHFLKYENGEFPKCFTPCPPFYDICNKANLETDKCKSCFEKHAFVDYIE